MEKEGLLDTLLYLGGVSGSTWSMSSVYSDPQWSANMDRAASTLSGPGVELEQALAWLGERAKEEFFSLTDIWGVLTSAGIMKQMDLRRLSDEASRNATNPYPIYSAIEKDCFSNGPIEDKVNCNKAASLESKSSEERKSIFVRWSMELLAAVDTWSQSLEDGVFKTRVAVLTKQVLPLIMKWEWGTTNNFLYQYEDVTVPPCLGTKERFHLIDAGLLINVAYPAFLGDKRDIDLIIAPEYSAGNIFETLTLARDYAAKLKKPFPEIDDKVLEEREWPKDCYVFEGKGKEPTIVYMPLFNRQNCQDAEEVKAKMEEFSTFQRPFSEEKIQSVLETAKANVKNNKEILLREINKAVHRRQSKRKLVLHHL
uniref:PLA2c domain-containing protein n=1 Tax=Scophthalmus maximus TaxID=52904 RepID=A0A8D3DW15_SCOMX